MKKIKKKKQLNLRHLQGLTFFLGLKVNHLDNGYKADHLNGFHHKTNLPNNPQFFALFFTKTINCFHFKKEKRSKINNINVLLNSVFCSKFNSSSIFPFFAISLTFHAVKLNNKIISSNNHNYLIHFSLNQISTKSFTQIMCMLTWFT